MRLKSWETPRKQGRNKKGKLGAARARQLKKRNKLMIKRLKENSKGGSPSLFIGGNDEEEPSSYKTLTTHAVVSTKETQRDKRYA